MPVYFIRAGAEGPVKIGLTQNVAKRMAGLQVGHYQPPAPAEADPLRGVAAA